MTISIFTVKLQQRHSKEAEKEEENVRKRDPGDHARDKKSKTEQPYQKGMLIGMWITPSRQENQGKDGMIHVKH